MKQVLLFFVILLLTPLSVRGYSSVYADAAERKWYDIRGAQVFVLDPSYMGQMDRLFYEFRRKGVNTVYLRVFHNRLDRTHLGVKIPALTAVYILLQKMLA